MTALDTQIPTNLSTEQVIVNHISVQAATEIVGYNAQYLRRLLRTGKLDGVKVGQVWLIDLASLQTYFSCALNSIDDIAEPIDRLFRLVERLEGNLEAAQPRQPVKAKLRESFISSIKRTAKPGLKVE